MRLLYFNQELNDYELIEEVISNTPIRKTEVVLLLGEDESLALLSAVAESRIMLENETYLDRIGVSKEEAAAWQKELARIVDATYIPE